MFFFKFIYRLCNKKCQCLFLLFLKFNVKSIRIKTLIIFLFLFFLNWKNYLYKKQVLTVIFSVPIFKVITKDQKVKYWCCYLDKKKPVSNIVIDLLIFFNIYLSSFDFYYFDMNTLQNTDFEEKFLN